MMQNINVEKALENGTKLDVHVYLSDNMELFIYNVGLKPKGKRKFTYIKGAGITNDYSYRSLDTEGRRKVIEEAILKECPENILMEALEEAWERMKPVSVKVW